MRRFPLNLLLKKASMSANPLRISLFFCIAGCACFVAGLQIGRQSGATTNAAVSSETLSAATLSPTSQLQVTSSQQRVADRDIFPADVTRAWETLCSAPASPATEDAALATLRKLAASDPARAMQFAKSAPTPRQRDLFIRAALTGWGSVDALHAGQWALQNIRLGERRLAVDAIVTGAMAHPENAIRTVSYLCIQDPQLAGDHGNTLVTELARAGHFDLASQFAADGPSEHRAAWLSTAFLKWAEYQPSAAIAAANAFSDATVRNDALQGVISGWAASDPAALVAYAQTLPDGEQRASAHRDGLQQWVSIDPKAASAWIDKFNPSRDLDAGVAAIATDPALVAKKPDVATSWAESIVDPELRTNTLLDLIRLWATTDLAGARTYAASSSALLPETRELALSSLQTLP
jgi:hypothetical protein